MIKQGHSFLRLYLLQVIHQHVCMILILIVNTISVEKKAGEKCVGMERLIKSDRLIAPGKLPCYKTFHDDYPVQPLHNLWDDTHGASDLVYVVQTSNKVIQRCLMMTTDPEILFWIQPRGSGTTAYVSEQWGRRWITIDTSRVSLALARSRIMGARYPMYLLADSKEGQIKEAELSRSVPSESATYGNIKHGFVYQRVPHITQIYC